VKLTYVNIAKGIGIILVIIGHSVAPRSSLALAIFSFHLPLFFFISGYVFNYAKYEHRGMLLLKNKLTRLILPYFVTGLLIIVYFIFLQNRSLLNNLVLLTDMVRSLVYGTGHLVKQFPKIYPVGSYWFLPCLFYAQIIFWVILKLTNSLSKVLQSALVILVCLSGYFIGKFIFLPYSVDIALYSQVFMYTGYMLRKSKFFDRKIPLFILIMFFLFWIYDIKFAGLSMNNREYFNPLISVTGAISACILVLVLSKYLTEVKNLYIQLISKLLNYCGEISLIILIFHPFDTDIFQWFLYVPGFLYANWFNLTVFRLTYSILIAQLLYLFPITRQIYFDKKKLV
jgi:acyltransferase